jgi:Sec-independent protein secretion pathway component TatC
MKLMVVRIISIVLFLLGLLCAWMFYATYLKWAYLFENGRYFDPRDSVVHHDSNVVWVILALAFIFPAAAIWILSRKRTVKT